MAFYEDISILPNNLVKCILCEAIIENNDQLIDSHIDSRKHKECYMKRMMSRNSLLMKNSEVFCQLCYQNINIAELVQHVQSPHHCNTLSELKEVIDKDGKFIQIPDKNDFIQCCICNSQVDFSPASVKDHIESEKHRRAKAMVVQPLNGIFSVEDSDDYLWCKICQVFFDNYIELIFQHVAEESHSKVLNKLLRLIDGHNITIDNYLQSPKQDKAFCNKCSIEVSCNVDNLQRHINGKKHNQHSSKSYS